MTTTEPPRTPFADIDAVPEPVFQVIFTALQAMAEHPEIRRVRQIATDMLAPGAGQRLLDAGAGAGEVARELALVVGPDGEVTAMDNSDRTLAAARALTPDGLPITFVRGDIEALEFADASFDGTRAERVLQHVDDPDRAVRELARVTRAGGTVCLIDTDWESAAVDGLPSDLVATERAHLFGQFFRHHRDMGRTLRRRLLRAGLTQVRTTPVTCLFPDPESAGTVLPFFNHNVPALAGVTPPDLRDTWFAEIAAAGARGDFLAVLTIWVATGVKAQPGR